MKKRDSTYWAMAKNRFLGDVMNENTEARFKFPIQPVEIAIVALMEEVGEVARGFLDGAKKDKLSRNLYEEAVQVASMAMRIATEYEYETGGKNGERKPIGDVKSSGRVPAKRVRAPRS